MALRLNHHHCLVVLTLRSISARHSFFCSSIIIFFFNEDRFLINLPAKHHEHSTILAKRYAGLLR